MEVIRWRGGTKRKTVAFTSPGFMVRVSPQEALTLIRSLSTQLLEKNPNSNRSEHYTEKGEYFSIAVHEKVKTPKEKELEIDHIYKKIKEAAKEERDWPLPKE